MDAKRQERIQSLLRRIEGRVGHTDAEEVIQKINRFMADNDLLLKTGTAKGRFQRQLAEKVGWRCELSTESVIVICKPPNSGTVTLSPGAYIIYNPDNEPLWTEGQHYSEATAWDYALRYLIPNWPENDGDALALCLNIARQKEWKVSLMPHHDTAHMAEFLMPGGNVVNDNLVIAWCSTPAEALARLALAALEGENNRFIDCTWLGIGSKGDE